MAEELKLGMEMRDKITGYSGMATTKSTSFGGNVQFGLQPKVKDDEPHEIPDAQFIDYHHLEKISDGVSDSIPPIPDTGLLIGEEGEDKASGYRGILTDRLDFFNGCTFYSIVAKSNHKDDKGRPVSHVVEWMRIKRLGKGISQDVPSEARAKLAVDSDTPREARPPGGPNRSVRSVMRGG